MFTGKRHSHTGPETQSRKRLKRAGSFAQTLYTDNSKKHPMSKVKMPTTTAKSMNPEGAEVCTDIRDIVTCKICFRLLHAPYTTQCGHTFCYTCLDHWFNKRKKTCPDCRTDIGHAPAPAYMIRDITERLMQLSDSQSELEVQREELKAVEIAKSTTGLFQGHFSGGHAIRTIIHDNEDGVPRCPSCTWEVEDGEDECSHCGQQFGGIDTDESVDSEDMEDGFSGDEDDLLLAHARRRVAMLDEAERNRLAPTSSDHSGSQRGARDSAYFLGNLGQPGLSASESPGPEAHDGVDDEEQDDEDEDDSGEEGSDTDLDDFVVDDDDEEVDGDDADDAESIESDASMSSLNTPRADPHAHLTHGSYSGNQSRTSSTRHEGLLDSHTKSNQSDSPGNNDSDEDGDESEPVSKGTRRK
ncbi:MAG: hypothetical protein M1828_006733 [Chrysothrix sp. TS-e1954]|nr:MAG: hypothetical protein M1828_006733 [Chrysothrix sp. TS-e1954]